LKGLAPSPPLLLLVLGGLPSEGPQKAGPQKALKRQALKKPLKGPEKAFKRPFKKPSTGS